MEEEEWQLETKNHWQLKIGSESESLSKKVESHKESQQHEDSHHESNEMKKKAFL